VLYIQDLYRNRNTPKYVLSVSQQDRCRWIKCPAFFCAF